MKFLKLYAIVLPLCLAFVFFGGWMLFDFNRHWYVATAACAFLLTAAVRAFSAQEERLEQLEKRLRELEGTGE